MCEQKCGECKYLTSLPFVSFAENNEGICHNRDSVFWGELLQKTTTPEERQPKLGDKPDCFFRKGIPTCGECTHSEPTLGSITSGVGLCTQGPLEGHYDISLMGTSADNLSLQGRPDLAWQIQTGRLQCWELRANRGE